MKALRQRFVHWRGLVAVTAVLAFGIGGTALAGSGKPAGERGEVVAAGSTSSTALGYRYARQTATNFAGQQNLASADCPNHEPVVGGGVFSTGSYNTQHVNSSYPTDDGDANPAPEDGWAAYVDNISSDNRVIVVYAICKRGAAGTVNAAGPGSSALGYRYVGRTETNVAGRRNVAKADCPNDEPVVGGGVRSSGVFNTQHVVSSNPFSANDSNGAPEDGWRAEVKSEAGADLSFTSYAICDKTPLAAAAAGESSTAGTAGVVVRGYRYKTRSVINEDDQIRGEVGCPASEPVVGGGVLSRGRTRFSRVNSSNPVDDGDSNDAAEDGWVAFSDVANPVGLNGIQVYAICDV